MRIAAPLALAAIFAVHAAAQSGIEIEAQSAQYDDEAQVFRFSGNVVADGGSISLRADELEVHAGGADHRYRATGAPARLEVTGAGGRRVRAAGSPIEFLLSSERLSISGGSLELDGTTVRARSIVHHGSSAVFEASGDVSIERGDMSIAGDALAAKGSGEDARVEVTGQPAAVSGGSADAPINATAQTVLLIAAENRIELSGEAVAQSAGGELAGDVIVYNTLDNTFVATGGERERVKMVMESAPDKSGDSPRAESPGGDGTEE